jgi:hypothetical protein
MSELKRLQTELCLTEEELADRLGMDLRTVRRRLADGVDTALISRKLLAVRESRKTLLVCEPAGRILKSYREHKNQHLYPDDRHLLLFIEDTIVIVNDRLQIIDRFCPKNGYYDYEKAEFTLVLAHLFYSLAFHGKKWHELTKQRPDHAREALRLYQAAIELVQKADLSVLSEEQAAHRESFVELLELNAMETMWQMAKRGYIQRKECLKELGQRKIVERLRNALRSPYNAGVWQIPHNGLIFASLFNFLKDMQFFYKELIAVQSGFHSWDFTPGETPTLREDQDLEAFRQAFAHLDPSRNK